MPKEESYQLRTPMPPIIQPQQGDPSTLKKPDDLTDEMVKGIRRVRSEYVINKMTKNMMEDAPPPPPPAHDPPFKMNFDMGAFMANALKQGAEYAKLLQDEHKLQIEAILRQMETVAKKAEKPQEQLNLFQLFLQFRELNNELVKDARATSGVAAAAPQTAQDLTYLVELKKIDAQMADAQRKHEVMLEELRQRHNLDMKKLELMIAADSKKQAFEEMKFSTEIEMKREEIRSAQQVRSDAMAGFGDLLKGVASGIDHEMEGGGAAQASIAARVAARKVKSSIPCPGEGCKGTLSLPPDLKAGQDVTCPECKGTFYAEAGDGAEN